MGRNHQQNIMEARRELNLWTNVALADFLGISKRTVIRNVASGGLPTTAYLQKLIDALAPKNHALAADLARTAGLRPPAAQPPSLEGTAGELLFLRLVHATADALDVSPRRAQAGLQAFFREAAARQVDLSAVAARLAQAEK